MSRLYLIRRNVESFVGPLTVEEMRNAYKRMAFGLQDEVSGHAGTWVAFDDLEKLKKKYPDVAKLVSEDMLAGWGMGENTGIRMMNDDTGEIYSTNRSRSMRLAVGFAIVAIVAFIAALYLTNQQRLSGKLVGEGGIPTVEHLSGLMQENKIDELVYEVGRNPDAVVAAATKSKNNFVSWIPYLRVYAFEKDGMMSGIRPKLLKGTGAQSAPTDCSMNMWRRRWKNSAKKWQAFLQGKKLVRSHWARILSWDPHWIARREGKGWIYPKNYYIGCIDMARKALQDVVSNKSILPGKPVVDWNKLGLAEINLRLDWLHRVSLGGVLLEPEKPKTLVTRWICYESARDLTELSSCLGTDSSEDNVASYDAERYGWNVVRLATKLSGTVPAPTMKLLSEQYPKLRRTDHFTRFDYRVELKFMKKVVKVGGSVDSIVQEISNDFPEVNLAH